MIELEKGIVKLADDLVIRPGYSFAEFKQSKYYDHQDGILIVELEDKVYLDGRCYYADLFFRNGVIYMLSLCCCDREFTELEEGRRKDFHDEILKSYGIDGSAEYAWGSVSSDYDPKGNASSINLTYNI